MPRRIRTCTAFALALLASLAAATAARAADGLMLEPAPVLAAR